ncbi:MAG: T9SS type A sorting domain-containing protein [Bacteroidota bacterium]
MKQNYTFTTSFFNRAIVAASLMCMLATTETSATPAWRPHRNGYGVAQTPAPGAYASALLGLGNGMVVSNVNNVAPAPYTLGTGNTIFYEMDTTSAFQPSTSSLTAGTVNEDVQAFAYSSAISTIFAATKGKGVFKSTDAGINWSPTGSGTGAFINVSVDNATGKLYAVQFTSPTSVTVSTNGGALFTADATLGSPNGIYFYGGYMYEYMPSGLISGIRVSSTASISFTTPTLPTGIDSAQFSGFTAFNGKVYGVGTRGVYATADNGATWTHVFSHNSSTCIMGTDSVLVVGTSDSGVFVSLNGTSFKQFSNGLHIGSGYSVTHLDTNSQYIIATTINGAGSTLFADSAIYVMKLRGTTTNSLYGGVKTLLGVQNVANNAPTISLFPNPATSRVAIEADGITSEHIIVTVCDMIGRTVMTHTFDNANNMQLDLSQISGGLYIVHVNDGTSIVSEKLVLSK